MRVPVDEVWGRREGNDFPVPVSLSLFTVASLFSFFHRIRKLLSPESADLKTIHIWWRTSIVKSKRIWIYN